MREKIERASRAVGLGPPGVVKRDFEGSVLTLCYTVRSWSRMNAEVMEEKLRASEGCILRDWSVSDSRRIGYVSVSFVVYVPDMPGQMALL